LFSITGPKQTRAPPHLGGIGADSLDVGFNPLGNRNIRPLEIFHLDVSRAGSFGGQFAELAQVHRARRDDGRIVTNSWMGRLVAFTLLHEPFHGVHHQRAGLPHSVLPQHVEKLQPKKLGERAPYTGYRYALIELMRCLADPRVGPQWRTLESRG
jgi:hypothetical protein